MTEPWTYVIQVEGRIGERWMQWFDDMQAARQGEPQDARTTLTGCITDQAALLGMLQKLYKLGLPLLPVQRTSPMDEAMRARNDR